MEAADQSRAGNYHCIISLFQLRNVFVTHSFYGEPSQVRLLRERLSEPGRGLAIVTFNGREVLVRAAIAGKGTKHGESLL